jgi:hypothetical protein
MKARCKLVLLLMGFLLGIAIEAQADLESYCNSPQSVASSEMAQNMIAAVNRARIMGKETITHRLGPTVTVNYGSRVIYEIRDSEIAFPAKAKIRFCQVNSLYERDLIARNVGWLFSDQVEQFMFSPMPNGFGPPSGPSPAEQLAMRRAVCEIYQHRDSLSVIFSKLPRSRQWWEGDRVGQSSVSLRALSTLTRVEEIQARAFATLIKKLSPVGRKLFLDEIEAGKGFDGVLESVALNQQSSQAIFETFAKEFFRMTIDNVLQGFRLCQNRADIDDLSKELLSRATVLH